MNGEEAPAAPKRGVYGSLEDRYYGLMDFLQDKLHIPIYSLINLIEGMGIPSFPVLSLLLLALAGGGGYLVLAGTAAPATVDLSVLVFTPGGERVSLATVTLQDSEGETIGEANTTEAGSARFTNLPPEILNLRVAREGYASAEDTVDLSSERTKRITLTPTVSLSPAKISTLPFAPTPLPPSDVELATPTYEQRDLPAPNTESKARLSVMVKEKGTGRLVNRSEVKIYNAYTDAELSEAEALNGIAIFQNLSSGVQVYLVVRSTGYITFEGKSTPFTLKPSTTQTVELETLNLADLVTTAVTTLDESRNKTTSSKVWILTLEQIILNETQSDGETSFVLFRNRQLHALAYKSGYLPARQYFTSGANVTLSLIKSNSSNSATLRVNVRDEANHAVSNASVSIYTSQMEFLFPAKPASGGSASFTDLPLASTVIVRASGTDRVAETSVELNESSKTITLVLRPFSEELTAVAVQEGTTTLLSSARLEFWQDNSKVSECTQAPGASCKSLLYVDRPITVKVFADGYLPGARSETLYKGSPKTISIPLVAIPPNGIQVLGPVVKDLNGEEVSIFPADSSYSFEFTISAVSGVERTGLYVRVGRESSASGSPAAIYGFNRAALGNSLLDVLGSDTYSTRTCASSTLVPSATNADYFPDYQKWVEVRLNGPGPHVVSFKVQGFPLTTAADVYVYSRGWARTSGANNTLFYNRSPVDSSFNLGWNSSSKDWCFANASEKILRWNCGFLAGRSCLGEPVCESTLQAKGGSCLSPEVCGPDRALCTGKTQCCKFGDSLVCQENCQTPVSCDPACELGEYCDASAEPASCQECTDATVEANYCAANCGGENEACCDAALASAGAGCRPGLVCGGWQKSESCSLTGVSASVSSDNSVALNCPALILAVNPATGVGQVRFTADARCGTPPSFTVLRKDNGATLDSTCLSYSNGFLKYDGKSGTCAFNASTGLVEEASLTLRYLCQAATNQYAEIPLTIIDESLASQRLYSAVQLTAKGGFCVAQEGTWKYRRRLSATNTAPTALSGYPVLFEFDKSLLQGKVNADGSDFRILTAAGLEFPYLLKSTRDTWRLWVPVDLDPTGSRSDLYVYYGNVEADKPSVPYSLSFEPISTNQQWEFNDLDGWQVRAAGLTGYSSLDPALPLADVTVVKTCIAPDMQMCTERECKPRECSVNTTYLAPGAFSYGLPPFEDMCTEYGSKGWFTTAACLETIHCALQADSAFLALERAESLQGVAAKIDNFKKDSVLAYCRYWSRVELGETVAYLTGVKTLLHKIVFHCEKAAEKMEAMDAKLIEDAGDDLRYIASQYCPSLSAYGEVGLGPQFAVICKERFLDLGNKAHDYANQLYAPGPLQLNYSCAGCPPCNCMIANELACGGTMERPVRALYHALSVPTGVLSLTHSGTVPVTDSTASAYISNYSWQLFAGNTPVWTWAYLAAGNEKYTDVQVGAAGADRLVFAFTDRRPTPDLPYLPHFASTAELPKMKGLTLTVQYPPQTALGEEEQP